MVRNTGMPKMQRLVGMNYFDVIATHCSTEVLRQNQVYPNRLGVISALYTRSGSRCFASKQSASGQDFFVSVGVEREIPKYGRKPCWVSFTDASNMILFIITGKQYISLVNQKDIRLHQSTKDGYPPYRIMMKSWLEDDLKQREQTSQPLQYEDNQGTYYDRRTEQARNHH